MTWLLVTAASILALLAVGIGRTAPAAEAAGARCGMTIRGKIKLTQDLDCAGHRPIQLVGQRAHLDLNGHTYTCGVDRDQAPPIKLRGTGTLLRNGNIKYCGVEMLEGGNHRLRNVYLDNFWDGNSVTIKSSSNEIVYSSLGGCFSVVSGSYNLIADNGFGCEFTSVVLSGSHTYFVNNVVQDEGGAGLVVQGSHQRVLNNKVIEGCIIEADGGVDNIIEGNIHEPELCEQAYPTHEARGPSRTP